MTGIVASYKTLFDFDQDGFFNEGVLTTDPLNLIVGARQNGMRWGQIYGYEGFETTRAWEPHDSGVWTYTSIQLTTADNVGAVPNGIVYGGGRLDPPPPADIEGIAVLPLTEYTVRVWARVNDGELSVSLVIRNQLGTLLETASTVAQSADVWTERTITFTTDEQTTFLAVQIYQAMGVALQSLSTRGLMLVLGDTLPTAFNAGAASNAYDDISAYVEGLVWGYGIPIYSEAISPPAHLEITLNNRSGDWTPENSASPFYPLNRGSLVKVVATYNAIEYTMFQGVTTSFQIDIGEHGKQQARVLVGDPMSKADRAEYLAELQLDVRSDEVMQAVFDSGTVLYPYAGHNWLLGVVGASELSSTTVTFVENLTDFEEGDTSFNFAGDITGAGHPVTAGRVLREYAYAELGGRLWWDAPTLKFKFQRRSHAARTTPSLTTIDHLELDEPPVYVWGDDVLNHFTLSYFPRKVGSVGSILYSMANLPLALAAGAERSIKVRFSSTTAPDATIAALTTILPVASTDYTANANADGSGANKTSVLNVNVTFSAIGATILLENQDSATIYVTLLQLRGTPLTAFTRDSVVEFSGESIVAHGEYRRSLDLPALDDAALAKDYANLLVQRYKEPLGRIESFSLWGNRSATNMALALGTEIGDAFELYDPIAMNAITEYVVTALSHQVNARGSHMTRITVEPLARATLWILDDAVLSLLGDTTRLGL